MRATNIIYCFVTAFLFLLTGCASTAQKSTDGNQSTPRLSASALYSAGKEALKSGEHQSAIRHFNTLATEYPVDKFVLQGQLELAYAYHVSGQTSSTIAITERFIKAHPQHKNIDYAYYLRGLTAYQAAIAKLDSSLDEEIIATTAPIPYEAQMALRFLHEIKQRFPDGKYSADTSQRIKTLNERVAQRLIFIAKQQLDQGDPARAALLAKTVIDEYPESSVIQAAAVITNQTHQLLELINDKQHNTTIAEVKAPLNSPPQATATTAPVTNREANSTSLRSDTQDDTLPVTDHVTNLPPSSKIRDTAWVMLQRADRYTIQVLSAENETLLRQQIKRNDLQDKVAYFKMSRKDTTWYSLIYGSYATHAEAQTATETLPASLRQSKAWIRKIGDIQTSLKSL